MTHRRRIGEKERMEIFTRARGVCHICGAKIDGGRDAWEIEHVIPLEMGGDEDRGSENLQPAHAKCHKAKTSEDAGHIAKSKRMRRRQAGIHRQPKSVLPGSRASRWKRKISGEVVER